jgi:hypothetical protein
MKPLPLLILLLALGAAGALVLWERDPVEAVREAEAPDGPPMVSLVNPATAQLQPGDSPESLRKQIAILEGQVEYLQGQVEALREENEGLIERLGTLGMKGGAKPDAMTRPPVGEPPDEMDYVTLGSELMALRKLQSLPIPVLTAPQAEVEKVILASLKRQWPGDRAERFTRALAALGAIPATADWLPQRAALLARQICGWYDEQSETIYLVEKTATEGAMPPPTDPVMALAHGHLSREFGKTLLGDVATLSTDARLAREALLRADASLIRLLQSLKKPLPPAPDALPAEDPDHPLNQVPIPVFLREMELFGFGRGFEFAQSLHSAGDFQQLTNAYTRPPVTTAEVMDTELYFNTERPSPTVIEWPEHKDMIATALWDDSLGKLACFTFLKAYNAEQDAGEAMKGWCADRLLAFPSSAGKRDHAVWQTLWSSAGDAKAFFKTLHNALCQRYDLPVREITDYAPITVRAQNREVTLMINRQGAGVLLIEADDTAFAKTARDNFE